MALIKCPECGKMISDKAEFCLGCGYPVKLILQKKTIDSNLSAEDLFELGYFYHEGENGYDVDCQKAFECVLLAAEKGLPSAQWKVANLYYEGDGIEKNFEECKRWIFIAANNDSDSAQYTLATWYETGELLSKNVQEAIRW